MKIFKNADGNHILRLSRADLKRISKKAGWEDLFPDDDPEAGSFVDYDLGDVDVEDVLSEMEDEEMERNLLGVEEEGEGVDSDYIAKVEEAMSILSPMLVDLSRGQWIDRESVVDNLVDAVIPLMPEDVDLSDPLSTVRDFLNKPTRIEDEDLKQGIRIIMEKADIPTEEIEESETTKRSASSKAPLGFTQPSDLWYKILKDK